MNKNTLRLGLSVLIALAAQPVKAGLEEAAMAYTQGNYAFSAAEWQRLAVDNNAQAQYQLGKSYANGQGVTQDYKLAFAWFSRAAELGNAEAQNDLGSMYATGQVFKKDYKHAVAWYARAAQQNHAQAQNNLGILYGLGKGVDQNDLESYKWLSIASINGYEKATVAKEKLAKALAPEQLAQAEALTQVWLDAYHPQYKK
jgi:TPR repeat protein